VYPGQRKLRVFSLPDGALLSEWEDESFVQTSRIALVPGTERFLLRSTALPRLVEGDWRARRWTRSLGEGLYGDTPLFALKDDQRMLAITDQEQRVRLHQMSDGVMLTPLRGKRSPLMSMSWSPDNVTLATGEDDGSVRLWQPERHRMSWEVGDAGAVGPLFLSGQEPMGLTHSNQGICTVNIDTGVVQQVHPSSTAVPAGWAGTAAFFVDRAVQNGPITLHSWQDGKVSLHAELQGTAGWAFGGADYAQLAGSRWVALASNGQHQLRIFDRSTGALVRQEVSEWHAYFPTLSPDERTLAVGSEDRSLRLLEWPGGRVKKSITAPSPVFSLTWTPDGAFLAAGCRDGAIRLYDGASLNSVAVLNGHASGVWGLHVSADGRRLVSASDDSRVRLWDMSTRQPLGRLPAGVIAPRSLGGFTAGGRAIAAALWGGRIIVWRGNE
jgi:WD40 repeat protein